MRICEVCGREIVGPAYLALIEGAELVVCSECVQYAKWFRKLGRRGRPQGAGARAQRVRSLARAREVRRTTRPKRPEELEVVEDFGPRVKAAREARGLTQEELGKLIGEKASVISRIESGRMAPDVALARKLEHALGIKLLVEAREAPSAGVIVRATAPKTGGLTLGDILAMSAKRGGQEGEG